MARDRMLEQEIRSALDGVWMVDTHEHLDTEAEFAAQRVDFGRLFLDYACCDLISAGCPAADVARIQSDGRLGPRDNSWRAVTAMPCWPARISPGCWRGSRRRHERRAGRHRGPLAPARQRCPLVWAGRQDASGKELRELKELGGSEGFVVALQRPFPTCHGAESDA